MNREQIQNFIKMFDGGDARRARKHAENIFSVARELERRGALQQVND